MPQSVFPLLSVASAFIVALLQSLAAAETVRLPPVRGAWVLDAGGNAIPPESFTRGLQASGLTCRDGELWSVGDQRSRFPGHLFRLDPKTGRLIGKPIPLEVPAKTDGESPELERYRAIPNSDFEGLCMLPDETNTLFGITEDKVPWVVEIRLTALEEARDWSARIAQLTPIEFPPGLAPWRDNPNYRFEGCAVSDDGVLYLAYERAQDDMPRLYRVSVDAARSGKAVLPQELPLDFASLPRRQGKDKALLNVNDIQFLRHHGRPALVAVLRDQERLLLIDLDRRQIERVVDLDLLDPTGTAIEWVSPEGVALDSASGRLWIINDPDSERQNYRARETPEPSGRFAEYAPLLFELKLLDVVGASK